MNKMKIDILSYADGEIDISKIKSDIGSFKSVKALLIFSSISDEFESMNVYHSFIDEVNTPFFIVTSAGTLIPEKYVDSGLVIIVFSGDIVVNQVIEKVDYSNVDETAEKLVNGLNPSDLILFFSSGHIRKCLEINKILLHVHDSFPETQIWGGNSVSPFALVSKDGVFSDYVGVLAISNVETISDMYTGFSLDKNKDCYTVTKSDLGKIYEIDGKPAPERFTQIQYLQPWIVNKVTELISRKDISNLMKVMSSMNRTLYDGFMKTGVKLLGFQLTNNKIAPCGISYVSDDYIIPGIYTPPGTKLYSTISTKESQLNVYNSVIRDFSDCKSILISSCLLRQYYINFDFENIRKKMNSLNIPFAIPYLAGEIGISPKTQSQQIFTSCSIQVLGFK
jgi:hypothetical protein